MYNYRLYSFTNYYLSGIQKGIQTAHLVSNLSLEEWYSYDHLAHIYKEWAEYDRTIIVLDGGNHAELKNIYNTLKILSSNKFPTMEFEEDENSLNQSCTAVGIILPESVYSGKGKKSHEKQLFKFLQKYSLASN